MPPVRVGAGGNTRSAAEDEQLALLPVSYPGCLPKKSLGALTPAELGRAWMSGAEEGAGWRVGRIVGVESRVWAAHFV